jgi:uncharacterized membrane protein SpoIIM required for sporulation
MAIFLVAMCAGFISADATTIEPRKGATFWLDAGKIIGGNLGATAILIASSLLTAGIAGLWFFIFNGYMVGRLVSGFPVELLPCLVLFAPLEIVSFSGAAATMCNLSLATVHWLRTAETTEVVTAVRPAVSITAIAIVGLLVAAFIESWVIQLWR